MTKKKDKIKPFSEATSALLEAVNDPLPDTFTDRQREIYQFVMRGFKQKAIAQHLGVSQPYIAAELKRMREKMGKQISKLDQNTYIGETLNTFQEVQFKAWELFHTNKDTNPAVAAKALDLVMTSKERSLKALMDVGIVQKAKQEHEHTMKVVPFIEKFEQMDDQAKQAALKNVIDIQLNDLEEPEPPQLIEGEIEDDDAEDVDSDE